MAAGSCRQRPETLPRWRDNGYFIKLRCLSPHFGNKSLHAIRYTDFHALLCILAADSAQEMMPFVRFIAACHNDAALPALRYFIEGMGQRARPAAVPHIRAEGNADGQWLSQLNGQHVQIADAGHNVIFLKDRRFIRNKIKILQVLLGWLQLHESNVAFRCCPAELVVKILRACCQCCQKCAVPVCIGYFGSHGIVVRHQFFVYLLPCILCSVQKSPRRHSAAFFLVPDAFYACCAIRVTKQRICIIKIRINKSYQHATPGQRQVWLVTHL